MQMPTESSCDSFCAFKEKVTRFINRAGTVFLAGSLLIKQVPIFQHQVKSNVLTVIILNLQKPINLNCTITTTIKKPVPFEENSQY